MIGKLIKGKGARGVLDYFLAPTDQKGDVRPRVKIVGGTFAGRDAREIAAEFGALHRLRPQLGVYVIHESLRLPDGDAEPDDTTWAAIAQTWADAMGIEDHVAVAHGDGHIHVAASRIKRDGSVVSDQHDYKRSEAAIRKIEIDFDLTVVESSHLLDEDAAVDHHKAPTKGQMMYAELSGELPPAMTLAALIDEIIAEGASVTDLIEILEAADVRVHPNIASTGRMNGLAYEVDAIRITSKALGRAFTWNNLQERGLSYEPSRDDEELRQAKSRRQAEAAELVGTTDGDRAAVRSDQDIQSIRQRHGDRRTEDPGRNGADLNIEPAAGIQDATNGRADVLLDGLGDIHGNDLDHLVYLAAAELDAGGGAGDFSDSGRSDIAGSKRLAQLADRLARDLARCGEQVGQFIQAIGAAKYQVMTRSPDTDDGKIKRRTWSANEMLDPKNVRWLRSENANRAGVYIRAMDRRVALIDDITTKGIESLSSRGFEPSVSVETSPDNYQAWIRMVPSNQPEPSPQAAKYVSRSLTQMSNGDNGAVGSERFGRLPGFTNRKPKHENGRGHSPWVTLISAAYTVAKAGQNLISAIERRLKERAAHKAAEMERRNAVADGLLDRDMKLSFGEVETLFLRSLDYSGAEQGSTQSEIDFRACGFALKHGSTLTQVEAALLQHSPNIEERHPTTADYVTRTVRAASSSNYAQGAENEGPPND